MSKETIELIQRMARENRLWNVERIRGELLKLDIRVSKRTVQKYMHARVSAPFGVGPQVLIRDGDKKYGPDFDRVAEGAGIQVLQIAACTPRMNAACERFLGGVRRECLDHVISLGERHVRSVLGQHAGSYFNAARPHQGIDQRIPLARHASGSDRAGKIVAFPVLSGLHHHYQRVA